MSFLVYRVVKKKKKLIQIQGERDSMAASPNPTLH